MAVAGGDCVAIYKLFLSIINHFYVLTPCSAAILGELTVLKAALKSGKYFELKGKLPLDGDIAK